MDSRMGRQGQNSPQVLPPVEILHCSRVPGALPGREAIDLEIFGMAGIPEEFGQEEDLAEPQGAPALPDPSPFLFKQIFACHHHLCSMDVELNNVQAWMKSRGQRWPGWLRLRYQLGRQGHCLPPAILPTLPPGR